MGISNPELEVDHRNHDKLDNRRANLRVATREQNTRNTRQHRDSRSGLKGVDWFKPSGKWRARITVDGRNIHLGYYASAAEAHDAYIDAAHRHHGDFACTGSAT